VAGIASSFGCACVDSQFFDQCRGNQILLDGAKRPIQCIQQKIGIYLPTVFQHLCAFTRRWFFCSGIDEKRTNLRCHKG